jgi:hypothetical protein
VSEDASVRVVIRSAFVPRFLRWTVGFQLGIIALTALGVLVNGLQGRELFTRVDPFVLVQPSVVFAVLAVFIALRRRSVGAAEITAAGIRPFTRSVRWDRRYPWPLVELVRVRAGLVGNRWLEVCPTGEPKFILTARPTRPAEVLDALERFAGPDHPLTRAYAETLDAEPPA